MMFDMRGVYILLIFTHFCFSPPLPFAYIYFASLICITTSLYIYTVCVCLTLPVFFLYSSRQAVQSLSAPQSMKRIRLSSSSRSDHSKALHPTSPSGTATGAQSRRKPKVSPLPHVSRSLVWQATVGTPRSKCLSIAVVEHKAKVVDLILVYEDQVILLTPHPDPVPVDGIPYHSHVLWKLSSLVASTSDSRVTCSCVVSVGPLGLAPTHLAALTGRPSKAHSWRAVVFVADCIGRVTLVGVPKQSLNVVPWENVCEVASVGELPLKIFAVPKSSGAEGFCGILAVTALGRMSCLLARQGRSSSLCAESTTVSIGFRVSSVCLVQGWVLVTVEGSKEVVCIAASDLTSHIDSVGGPDSHPHRPIKPLHVRGIQSGLVGLSTAPFSSTFSGIVDGHLCLFAIAAGHEVEKGEPELQTTDGQTMLQRHSLLDTTAAATGIEKTPGELLNDYLVGIGRIASVMRELATTDAHVNDRLRSLYLMNRMGIKSHLTAHPIGGQGLGLLGHSSFKLYLETAIPSETLSSADTCQLVRRAVVGSDDVSPLSGNHSDRDWWTWASPRYIVSSVSRVEDAFSLHRGNEGSHPLGRPIGSLSLPTPFASERVSFALSLCLPLVDGRASDRNPLPVVNILLAESKTQYLWSLISGHEDSNSRGGTSSGGGHSMISADSSLPSVLGELLSLTSNNSNNMLGFTDSKARDDHDDGGLGLTSFLHGEMAGFSYDKRLWKAVCGASQGVPVPPIHRVSSLSASHLSLLYRFTKELCGNLLTTPNTVSRVSGATAEEKRRRASSLQLLEERVQEVTRIEQTLLVSPTASSTQSAYTALLQLYLGLRCSSDAWLP